MNGRLCALVCLEGNPEAGAAGDSTPEGIRVLPAVDSPTKQPLLTVNEASGRMAILQMMPPAVAAVAEA
jgi:hypothetical protein